MNLKINKEVCYPCSKSINVGQPMLECENCTKVIHTRCFKSASFKCKNGLWMCPGCALITEDRYCPFDNQNDLEKSDRPYNGGAEDTLIQKFCHTLESCKRYSKREFTEVATKISSGERQGSFLSALFLNILKFDVPQSIKDLFKFCPRNDKLRLIVPLMRLDVSQQNFLYTSTKIWNDLIPYVFEICDANEDGIIIPGSSKNSDLSASSGIIKSNLKKYLLSLQNRDDPNTW